MKKIVAFVLITFLFVFATATTVHAVTPSPTPTTAPVALPAYQLPYPGILPDHPLYKLKLVRDKIMLSLINDPIRKVEFHLRLADKKMFATQMLADKGKLALASETALKAEHEYTLITFLLKDSSVILTADLFEKLNRAAQKHQELLTGIASKAQGEEKKTFETVLEFSQRNQIEILNLFSSDPEEEAITEDP